MRAFVFISIVIAFIAGCTFDKGSVPIPQEPCDTTHTYTSNIQQLISVNCTDPGCHQPGSTEGDLTAYNTLRLKVDNGMLRTKVVIQGTMPPTAPLSTSDKRKIECWLDNGAPEN